MIEIPTNNEDEKHSFEENNDANISNIENDSISNTAIENKQQRQLPSSEDYPTHSSEGEFHGDVHAIPITLSRNVYLYAFCAALNSCNLGYDIGVNTSVSKILEGSMNLSNVQLEIFLGSLNLFAMVGALCAPFISDGLGRRRAFQVSSIVFIIGIIIMASSVNYGLLIFGRVFVGLGVGFGLAIDPIYISEISPAFVRGRLVTWSEIAINVGLVFGFSSGLIFSGVQDNIAWRLMFATGAILPIILIILVSYVMPESPRWLVAKGREEEAAAILREIYPLNFPVERIVAGIRETIRCEIEAEHAVSWGIILDPSPAFRRMLFVGIGSAIAQQAVGIEAIQYYLVFIIDQSGIKDPTMQSLVIIMLGIVKLIVIFIAGRNFDKMGRRPFMLISLGGMAIALLIQAFNFLAFQTNSILTVIALALYLIFFSLGMGPGAWLISSEVFSTSIRAKAMSLSTFSNRFVGTIMSSTFLSVASAISWAGFFLLLTIVCFVIATFFYYVVPETKGRSLEDMVLYFAEITNDRAILEVESRINSANTIESGSGKNAESTIDMQDQGIVASGTMT